MHRHTRFLLMLGAVLGLECAAAGQSATTTTVKQEATMKAIAPSKKGFISANGIRIWHEVYGQGEPLVLLHGGLTTIPEQTAWIEPLSKKRQVIALELQGHGRTPDTERPLAMATLGDDVAAVIEALGFEQVDLAGHSFGADVALRTAIQHPTKIRRLVVISTAYAKRGWYPEVQEGMAGVSAAMAETMMQTPTGQFSRSWPEPDRFPKFLDKMGKLMSEDYDWSAEIRRFTMPVLLVFTDHDSVSQQHIAEFFALLGGGISEPGWQNTKFTNARLAIIPGYSHYNFISANELPPIVERYLTSSLEGSQEGAAAASAASPARE